MQWIRLIVIGVCGCCAMPMAGAASSSDYPDMSITEQPREHPSDAQLREQVEEALHKDVRIHWDVLEVKAVDGKVDVFGIVRTPEEKALVTAVVSNLPGVTAVGNHVLARSSLHEGRAVEGKEDPERFGPTPF